MTDKAERLKQLAARIDDMIETRRIDLIHQLETEDGMKLTYKTTSGGIYTCRLAGITATATSGEAQALRNWAAAARRELLKLEAQAS
jgi:hypothetical protein